METPHVIALLGLVLTTGTALVYAVRAFSKVSYISEELLRRMSDLEKLTTKLAAMDVKVETLWQFQMRRAEVELTQKGVGRRQSPLQISADARAWLDDIAPALRAFYRRLPPGLKESDVLLALERAWGEQIVERICLPHGFLDGACLLIALAVARGDTSLVVTKDGEATKEGKSVDVAWDAG